MRTRTAGTTGVGTTGPASSSPSPSGFPGNRTASAKNGASVWPDMATTTGSDRVRVERTLPTLSAETEVGGWVCGWVCGWVRGLRNVGVGGTGG